MRITAIVEALVSAGATPDMILSAVRAAESQDDNALERRRQNDRDRKARQREIEAMSREVTGSHNDRQPSAPHARVEDSSSKEEITGKAERKGRATRLPPNWTLPSDWRDEAIAAGLPPERADAEGRKMLNWSLSDTKGAKHDWHATWRNWYVRSLEALSRATGPPKKVTLASMWRDEGRKFGILPNEPPLEIDRRVEAGFPAGSAPGTNFARRIAGSGGE